MVEVLNTVKPHILPLIPKKHVHVFHNFYDGCIDVVPIMREFVYRQLATRLVDVRVCNLTGVLLPFCTDEVRHRSSRECRS